MNVEPSPKLTSIIGSSEARPPTIHETDDVKIRMCLVRVIFVFTFVCLNGDVMETSASLTPHNTHINGFILKHQIMMFFGALLEYDIFLFLLVLLVMHLFK